MSATSDTLDNKTGGVEKPFLRTQNWRKGVLFALTATFAWSTTAIIIDELITKYQLTPLEISVWRCLLATPILAGFLALRQPGGFRLSRREIIYYFIYGAISIAIFNIIWNVSVQINKAPVATSLIFSAPVFVAVGAKLLFGEQIRLAQVGAIIINLIGCALVAGVYDPTALVKDPLGLLVGLGSGLCFGAATLFGKGAAHRGRRSSATILFYIYFFGSIVALAIGLTAEGGKALALNMDWVGWLLLVGLAVGPTLAGWVFFTLSLNNLPASAVSLFTTLEPTLTALLSLLFLGRSMNGLQWLGTILIVGGVMVMQALTFSRSKS